MRPHAASPRTREYLLRLAGERRLDDLGTCGEERIENVGAMLENGLTQDNASYWIRRLLAAPFDDEDVVEPGVYRLDETIYVVRQNKTNPRVHARRLVEIGGRRLTEADTIVQIEFVYDEEALARLRPEHQMSLEEARPFIIRYGKCIFCNTPLSDAKSVERGVGPVCAKRYRVEPATQRAVVSNATLTALSALVADLKE